MGYAVSVCRVSATDHCRFKSVFPDHDIVIDPGVLRGVGDAIRPVIIIALGVCLLRVIWILTCFQLWQTLFVLSICYPISWGISAAALLLYYFKGSMFARKKEQTI